MDGHEGLLWDAMRAKTFSVMARSPALTPTNDLFIICILSTSLQREAKDVISAWNSTFRNVRTILRRQIFSAISPTPDQPVCRFSGEGQFQNTLGTLPLGIALLTLARIYDEAHVTLCKCRLAARKARKHHQEFLRSPVIDLHSLTRELWRRKEAVDDRIVLERTSDITQPLRAEWKSVTPMSFDRLPRLNTLAGRLPGEDIDCHGYAGIGGGGGSDIISASLLGRLLEGHKKQMKLLVSTRTWATGSQGKKGSKLGIKREVYNHGGQAESDGKPVSGTYRISKHTTAEGRDLETIPLAHHDQIYMVLDQGDAAADVPENERAELKDQFNAVLAQAEGLSTYLIVNTGGNALGPPRSISHHASSINGAEQAADGQEDGGRAERHIDTVLSVDTGGDVFGRDGSGGTTPDQDFRVQKAINTLPTSRNLVTAVVAPGVDAPEDAPQKAYAAGGHVYKPTKDEEQMLLDILAEYRMDGSDPNRFGKTTLALQARLKGNLGWTSLDLPEHVVDTWENPWSSFVYIQECMSDIILMPTRQLLPLIEPAKQDRVDGTQPLH